ncbi:MAG: hydrogen peroxide-inducible s activator [Devosia sp.]|nr:hydrogen peroxide-inducible s activator [Devosia sp.]
MSFSLKQMRYIVAVADSGHFGQAAAACNISQPALSQQIQSAEEICGTALFDRLKSGTRPTPFGQEFVARARLVLDGADALAAFAQHNSGKPNRAIRFGLIPTVAPYLLPDIFPALTRSLPDLAFAVSENRTEALIDGLVDGSLDVALIGTEAPEHGPRLVSRPLFEDPFVLATGVDEKREGPVALKSISPERILLLDEGHCFREQTIAACRLDSNPSGRTFAATSLSTIVEFVANGQGVTLLPRIALRKEANDPRIAIHTLAAPGAGRTLSLVWREATPFGSTFEQMAELIRTVRLSAPAAETVIAEHHQ